MTPAAGRARVGSAAVAAPAHDVITMGRIGADIYPQSDGPLEGVTAFSRSLGGRRPTWRLRPPGSAAGRP